MRSSLHVPEPAPQRVVKHRHDIRLTAAHRFVFAQDVDGEIVATLIAWDDRGKLGRICDPFRLVMTDLEEFLSPEDVDRDWGTVRVRLQGDFAQFLCHGTFAGNATREHMAKTVRSFLTAVRTGIPAGEPDEFVE